MDTNFNTPKVSVLTVTYDRDLEWLNKSWNSFNAFCKTYHSYNVVIDNHERDCAQSDQWLQHNNINYYIDTNARNVSKGYVRQQYMKFYSDLYVPDDTEWICHVDSDSIFYKEHTPEMYFNKDGKPTMLMTSYESIKRDHPGEDCTHWQDIITEALKLDEPIEYEFMRRMPLIYPKWLFEEMRKWFISNHGVTILEYLKDVDNFTEYNFFGAYCWIYHREVYDWIDTADLSREWDSYPFLQEHSHDRVLDKEKLMDCLVFNPEIYLWLEDVVSSARKHGCDLNGIDIDHITFSRNKELRDLYKFLLIKAKPHMQEEWPD